MLRYLRNHKDVFEQYRTEIQSLLNYHVNGLDSAQDETSNSEAENDDLSDSESQEAENDDLSKTDKAAILWKAIQDHIPGLWERIKLESLITFEIEQKDVRVAYIQHQRGSKKASNITIDDKIRTGLSELALANGFDDLETRKGYQRTADRWAQRLFNEEVFTRKSFLEGPRGCTVKSYVQSFDFREGSPEEKTAITGTRYGRKSLVGKLMLEHATSGKVDGFGLQCLTSLAHQEWKMISLPELKGLIEIIMEQPSDIKLSDSDGNIETISVLDFLRRVSLWYRGLYEGSFKAFCHQ